MSFEVNQGQVDAQVNFLSRGKGYTLFLSPNAAVLSLHTSSKSINSENVGESASTETVTRMKLVGANAHAPVSGLGKLPGKVNYLRGNDQTKWFTGIPVYAKVKYQTVYPGVDLVYYGNQQQLEYDFVVAPGTDSKTITLGFEGADKLEVDAQGELVVHTAGGQVHLHKPLIYQETNGVRQEISGGYALKEKKNEVSFRVGAYDASRPLVIDPVLVYSTYLGGSAPDESHGIAVDSAGNAYITGITRSSNFPSTLGAFQAILTPSSGPFCCNPTSDIFVTKLNATGTALVYSTYIGGGGPDNGISIAVDSAGNAYVTGETQSTDFPITAGAFEAALSGDSNAFVIKLNAEGNGLLYSTYFGGNGGDQAGFGIAVDAASNIYVTNGAS
ncbi:SBBP repeat-containing protein [Candidatus Acetothermia bacterium]|nr:SBBP repeat-containing protein [Candidatus Acetothermia bacterium]